MMILSLVFVGLAIQLAEQAGIRDRIMYGRDVPLREIPYQAGISIIHPFSNFFCGGSLISDRHILTAQHCLNVSNTSPTNITVYLGSVTRLQGRSFTCSGCWTNFPNYNEGNFNGDISVITLDTAVEQSDDIRPVKLPTRSDRESSLLEKSALISGWGETEKATLSDNLKAINATVLSRELCSPILNLIGISVAHDHICTRTRFFQGVCRGDSGGPLVVNERLYGVISYGYPSIITSVACYTTRVNAYTSVIQYLDWIQNVTGIPIDN